VNIQSISRDRTFGMTVVMQEFRIAKILRLEKLDDPTTPPTVLTPKRAMLSALEVGTYHRSSAL
jgi:hypothetical protein